jgi:hypothetical protein
MKEVKKIIPVPPGLSEKSQTLWREIAGKRASSPSRLSLLEVALRALDRSDQAAELIGQQGLTSVTPRSGATHLNPLTKLEIENRSLFFKIMASLGLRFDPVKPAKFEDYKFE